IVIYPFMIVPLFVSREKSIRAVDEALGENRMILLVSQRDLDKEEPTGDDLYKVGTVAVIMRMLKLPDGRTRILVQGLTRANVDAVEDAGGYLRARLTVVQEPTAPERSLEVEALVRNVRASMERAANLGKNISPEVMAIVASLDEPGRLADLAASNLELKKLERMHPDAAETATLRNWLEIMTDLPWSKASVDNLDLKKAQQILDEDHYGLEKVKERIIEALAVRKLKERPKGSILCLVGPPGVGKTSLGRSIARALDRKFVRLSLGGLHDEAEIRGHRRTYVGAMPGRVIQALQQAGTNNPLIMLDEIDKVGADFRGDPSSALLE